MPLPIEYNGAQVDLTSRFAFSTTVAASPAAATETTIATLTLPGDVAVMSAVVLIGWAAFTVGTNGTSFNLKLRRTDTSGNTRAASGLINATAANLVEPAILGFDTAPSGAQVYVLTLTVTAASAASTVSAVGLAALNI